MSGILSSDVENRVDDEGRPFLEGDAEYDNSKNLRRGAESLLDMVKTPSEIVQSLSDVSFVLLRDLLISVALFFFGVHGPKRFILPLIGGLTMRPIPYQTTQAGDILLDLTLSNEFIEKSDVTFTCEFGVNVSWGVGRPVSQYFRSGKALVCRALASCHFGLHDRGSSATFDDTE